MSTTSIFSVLLWLVKLIISQGETLETWLTDQADLISKEQSPSGVVREFDAIEAIVVGVLLWAVHLLRSEAGTAITAWLQVEIDKLNAVPAQNAPTVTPTPTPTPNPVPVPVPVDTAPTTPDPTVNPPQGFIAEAANALEHLVNPSKPTPPPQLPKSLRGKVSSAPNS